MSNELVAKSFLTALFRGDVEEGSPMADLRHVLLQDGKYIPPDERPVSSLAVARNNAPYEVRNERRNIMERAFGPYAGIFMNPEAKADSMVEIIDGCIRAIDRGEVGFDRGESLEVIVDDREAPGRIEADTVVVLSQYPIRLDRIDCGALLVYCPDFRAEKVKADSYTAILTDRCHIRKAELHNGAVASPVFRSQECTCEDVTLFTNNNIVDDGDGVPDFVIDFRSMDRRQRNKLANAAVAFGDLAGLISEIDCPYLYDEDYAELEDIAQRLTRSHGRDRNYGCNRRGRNGRRSFDRGYRDYEDWDNRYWDNDDDYEDGFSFFNDRRSSRGGYRPARDGSRRNQRPGRGRTNLRGLDRLENLLANFGRRLANWGRDETQPQPPARRDWRLRVNPQQAQRPAAPQQPAQPVQAANIPLTPAELALVNNLSAAQLKVVLAPLAQQGVDVSQMSKNQLIPLVQATCLTNQAISDLARALIAAGLGTPQQPQQPQQPQPQAGGVPPTQPII